MLSNFFSLTKVTNGDIIAFANSAMTIEVYNLKYYDYRQQDTDMVFYATGNYPMAFLVKNFDKNHQDIINIALRWYAVLEGYGEMYISLNDPRPKATMRIVR